jgi:hypothetical protein
VNKRRRKQEENQIKMVEKPQISNLKTTKNLDQPKRTIKFTCFFSNSANNLQYSRTKKKPNQIKLIHIFLLVAGLTIKLNHTKSA